MTELTLYLALDDEAPDPEALAARVEELDAVEEATVEVEDDERGAVETLNEITLVVKAAGGTAAALAVAVGQLKALLAELGIHGAEVQTGSGTKPLEEVSDADTA